MNAPVDILEPDDEILAAFGDADIVHRLMMQAEDPARILAIWRAEVPEAELQELQFARTQEAGACRLAFRGARPGLARRLADRLVQSGAARNVTVEHRIGRSSPRPGERR